MVESGVPGISVKGISSLTIQDEITDLSITLSVRQMRVDRRPTSALPGPQHIPESSASDTGTDTEGRGGNGWKLKGLTSSPTCHLQSVRGDLRFFYR